jgi:SdpC family antimicrobial peptide
MTEGAPRGVKLDARSASSRYTSEDVIELLAFASGPIVDEHPDIVPSSVRSQAPSPTARRKASESIATCLKALDPSIDSDMSAAFQAAEPYRIEGVLGRINAAAEVWQTSPPLGAPCPPPPAPNAPGTSGSNHVKVTGELVAIHVGAAVNVAAAFVSVAVALVISVAAVVFAAFLLVPVAITYQFEVKPSQLDIDESIANIAEALRR